MSLWHYRKASGEDGGMEEREKGKWCAQGFPVRQISTSGNEAKSAHRAVN